MQKRRIAGVAVPYGENPSCLQTTLASILSQKSVQIVPQVPLIHTSTLPLSPVLPPRRMSPSVQWTEKMDVYKFSRLRVLWALCSLLLRTPKSIPRDVLIQGWMLHSDICFTFSITFTGFMDSHVEVLTVLHTHKVNQGKCIPVWQCITQMHEKASLSSL